ncbi:glutathione S-transferase family protein [Sphingobium sp. MK2]|uniref:glutathione S-transferase family protein n=1 Tax=Sphingobium sp. MK2 TaxID=3116540 RepID=UPI0032E3675A
MTITLYHFPSACSRVTMHALEELGLEYDDYCVNIMQGAQRSAEYLSINPHGKVPALDLDGKLMTENAAILWTLHRHFGGNKLFSTAPDDAIASHDYRADLSWCSGTMHPMVRQVRMPMRFTTGEQDGVRADGTIKLTEEYGQIAARIGDGWWYGESWSIIDTYIYWGCSTASKGGFALDRFPALIAHGERVRARPAFQRVLAREQAALDREGITGVAL